MTGFNSKRDAAADKDALFEKFEVAQPAQEPVAIFDKRMGRPILLSSAPRLEDEQPLYTTPPKREWVGLTPEETSGFTKHEMTVVKYVSKVLQEKNT